MTDKPTRRDLMKPLHLLGVAFVAALFGGFVTAMTMGAFAEQGAEVTASAWRMAAIMAGIVFIAVLLILALLLLAVDPKDVAKPQDGPVLLPKADEAADDATDDGDAEDDRR